jgi:polysaccharide export outer membrane protein
LVVPAGGITPRELGQASLPQYIIEPPDNLTIEAVLRDPRSGQSDRLPVQPIAGDYVVRPDGTVNLGVWGTVRVAGLTTTKAADAIRAQLASFTQVNGTGARLETLAVTVDVKNKNSQVYYIIADAGQGETVIRMPCTGTETVLDAIAAVPGLAAVADRRSIRVVRKGAGDQILPVDWNGILHHGDTRTNYALMSGDRVYVTGR